MKKIITLGGIFLFTFCLGCATMSDVAKEKDNGTSKVYPVNFEQAWLISKTVLRWEGADAIEEHKDEGYMLTSSGINLVTNGTVMGAWIESVDNENSKVTVVTKRRLSLSIFTTLTESTYHERFLQAVEIIRSGKPLPITPPQ